MPLPPSPPGLPRPTNTLGGGGGNDGNQSNGGAVDENTGGGGHGRRFGGVHRP